MESKNFEDLYEVLDADLGSSKKEIVQKYKERLSYYKNIIAKGQHLDDEQKWEIKLLKIAKYVLTDEKLRRKYNVSRIIMDSEESMEKSNEKQVKQNSQNMSSNDINYREMVNDSIPLRKDKSIDLQNLADRQFERFDHKNFDLATDRELRG